jgi:membrane-bound ClpP family serine protease
VAVLSIRDEIDRVTLRSLERRVRQAERDGAEAIVLEIDTPGGAVLATLDILHLIRTEAPANTVAWINPKAYSAGTIIALACREIVVAPDAAFGDSAPISRLGPLPQAERAKQEAPILAEVIDSARRNHYDEKLVQAFVSVGVELWLIENKATGVQVFVDREEYRLVFGDDPPDQITPVALPSPQPGGQIVPPVARQVAPLFQYFAPVDTMPVDPEELKRQIEFEQDLPSSRPLLTEADSGKWRLVRQVVPNDRLLVVKPAEAISYGLATTVIANDDQLKAYFGAHTLLRYDRSWSESLVRFLTNPIVMGVLILIFVVCLLIELAAPGLGVFGATAFVSLLVLIGAPWLAGMAQWWEIMLIMLGLLLVAAELFVIPGFGVAGISGALCLLVGLIGTFVTGDVRTPTGQSELVVGLVATLTSLFAAAVVLWLVARQMETLPILGKFVLKTELGAADMGDGAGLGLLEAMGHAHRALELGDLGVAATDLRPAGRANFQGRPVDVKSVSTYIERGSPVRVVSVGRFVIEVEETKR